MFHIAKYFLGSVLPGHEMGQRLMEEAHIWDQEP